MDEHYTTIQDLCRMYYHDKINDDIRTEIVHHLIRTRDTASATELIVNRLTVESRIEVFADILLLSDLITEGICQPAEQIFVCLKKIEQSDRTLGSFVKNRLSDEEKMRITRILVEQANLMLKFREQNPTLEEVEAQAQLLQDKSVYSYQTMLELTVASRRAKTVNQPELMEMFDRLKNTVKMAIDSFKLYRS